MVYVNPQAVSFPVKGKKQVRAESSQTHDGSDVGPSHRSEVECVDLLGVGLHVLQVAREDVHVIVDNARRVAVPRLGHQPLDLRHRPLVGA